VAGNVDDKDLSKQEDMNMDTVVTKLRKYANDLASNERLLETLESDAENMRAGMEAARAQRDAVAGDIEGIQDKITALQDERRTLQRDYAEAMFDDDQDRLDSITTRRVALDLARREYEQVLSDKQSMLADLDEPDVEEAARLSAKLGTLDFADGYTWASSIRQELVNHHVQLRTRVQAAQRGLPSEGNAAYEQARRNLDADYDARLLEEERMEAYRAEVEARKAEEAKYTWRDRVDPKTGLRVRREKVNMDTDEVVAYKERESLYAEQWSEEIPATV